MMNEEVTPESEVNMAGTITSTRLREHINDAATSAHGKAIAACVRKIAEHKMQDNKRTPILSFLGGNSAENVHVDELVDPYTLERMQAAEAAASTPEVKALIAEFQRASEALEYAHDLRRGKIGKSTDALRLRGAWQKVLEDIEHPLGRHCARIKLTKLVPTMQSLVDFHAIQAYVRDAGVAAVNKLLEPEESLIA
jgi:type I site-specific restriction endonuclease